TRYGWPRRPWYADSRPPAAGALQHACRFSNLLSFFNQQIDRNQIDALPEDVYRRQMVDCPCCTPAEYSAVLDNYRHQLEALADWCDKLDALLIVVTPPSNLGSFPPNRSYLAATASAAEREAFRRDFLAACSREEQSPGEAEPDFRRLLAEQPLFAESHFRLARMLERQGKFDEAELHFSRARDLDGMPLRCPTDFAAAANEVCRRHPRALWVDGSDVFRRLSPHGIADDHLMHDAQHPKLRGYIELAKEVLDQLRARRALGLPEGVAPPVQLSQCVEHFGIERSHWEQACTLSAQFYEAVAGLRYAPDVLLRRSEDYRAAARRIAAGDRPEEVEVLGLASWSDRPAAGNGRSD
ncbi:MAG TPA: tetratricopeptide repeat protein, partial [Pirellulales bacterium]|nr:tetratricopeptide repeat protein [Pirellulales bacterium]